MTNLSWVFKLPALLMDSMSGGLWVDVSVTACGGLSLANQLVGHPVGQNYSAPDGGCPEHAWWHHVSSCFLSCHALYNSQEEDSVPPRPPLPQSYEPNPPTVPPMPSHAGVRPPSLHRPEERKANHRNGTHSVSLLSRWPHGWPCPQLCHHTSLLAVMVFIFILVDISCLLDCFWLDLYLLDPILPSSLYLLLFVWNLTCVFLFLFLI